MCDTPGTYFNSINSTVSYMSKMLQKINTKYEKNNKSKNKNINKNEMSFQWALIVNSTVSYISVRTEYCRAKKKHEQVYTRRTTRARPGTSTKTRDRQNNKAAASCRSPLARLVHGVVRPTHAANANANARLVAVLVLPCAVRRGA